MNRNLLLALEQSNFENLPDPQFTHHYIAAYCRCLSLNADKVNEVFDRQYHDYFMRTSSQVDLYSYVTLTSPDPRFKQNIQMPASQPFYIREDQKRAGQGGMKILDVDDEVGSPAGNAGNKQPQRGSLSRRFHQMSQGDFPVDPRAAMKQEITPEQARFNRLNELTSQYTARPNVSEEETDDELQDEVQTIMPEPVVDDDFVEAPAPLFPESRGENAPRQRGNAQRRAGTNGDAGVESEQQRRSEAGASRRAERARSSKHANDPHVVIYSVCAFIIAALSLVIFVMVTNINNITSTSTESTITIPISGITSDDSQTQYKSEESQYEQKVVYTIPDYFGLTFAVADGKYVYYEIYQDGILAKTQYETGPATYDYKISSGVDFEIHTKYKSDITVYVSGEALEWKTDNGWLYYCSCSYDELVAEWKLEHAEETGSIIVE